MTGCDFIPGLEPEEIDFEKDLSVEEDDLLDGVPVQLRIFLALDEDKIYFDPDSSFLQIFKDDLHKNLKGEKEARLKYLLDKVKALDSDILELKFSVYQVNNHTSQMQAESDLCLRDQELLASLQETCKAEGIDISYELEFEFKPLPRMMIVTLNLSKCGSK